MEHPAEEKLDIWRACQDAYVRAREEYRVAWATAFATHEAVKPETARKAKADLETTELRKKRDDAETSAAVTWQAYVLARGPIEGSRQPGTQFSTG